MRMQVGQKTRCVAGSHWHTSNEVCANSLNIVVVLHYCADWLQVASAGFLQQQITILQQPASPFIRRHRTHRRIIDSNSEGSSIKVRNTHTREVINAVGLFAPDAVAAIGNSPLGAINIPMLWHIAKPRHTRRLIRRVGRSLAFLVGEPAHAPFSDLLWRCLSSSASRCVCSLASRSKFSTFNRMNPSGLRSQ